MEARRGSIHISWMGWTTGRNTTVYFICSILCVYVIFLNSYLCYTDTVRALHVGLNACLAALTYILSTYFNFLLGTLYGRGGLSVRCSSPSCRRHPAKAGKGQDLKIRSGLWPPARLLGKWAARPDQLRMGAVAVARNATQRNGCCVVLDGWWWWW